MTGRRLYEQFTNALGEFRGPYDKTVLPGAGSARTDGDGCPDPVAWPFLSHRDQLVWNALARRITPRPKA